MGFSFHIREKIASERQRGEFKLKNEIDALKTIMNDCEKKGCNLCRMNSAQDGGSHIDGQTSHPEVTDVKNRELILFFLVIVIMAVIGLSGFVLYDKFISPKDSNSTETSSIR